MALHHVTFYLEGGHEVSVVATEVEVQVTEDAQIAGYTLKNAPEENLSYFYLKPSAIIGIRSVLLEADEKTEPRD